MTTVVQITKDCDGKYVLEMSDGSVEDLECFNCGAKDISTVCLYLTETSSATPPLIPEEIRVKQFLSLWKDEHANGICYDQECIDFSECRLFFTESISGPTP